MSHTPISAPPSCGGRFSIRSFLGAGGMGAVYEAYDHQRQSPVAVKVMHQSSGPWIYRFKHEFRTLAGIVHPNLVTLHDLIQWQDQWLFTMELVPGVTFARAGRMATLVQETRPVEGAAHAPDAEPPTVELPVPATGDEPTLLDPLRLGDALRQLCDGLDHLHRLGIAHADVKPANALVTPEGRVVLLDFGISRVWRSEGERSDSLTAFGTPGYLAPERMQDHLATPAADMYAVGVTLFEVLAGRRPDGQDPAALLRTARSARPVEADAVSQREVLENLCLRLLDRDPDARPTAAEAREAVAFEAERLGTATPLGSERSGEDLPFVARAAERESIRNALLDKRPHAPRFVIVSGESGIGKSELLRRILDEDLPASWVALEGKCYEREQVPYRAMDRLIDALSTKLLDVDADAIRGLSWADVSVVARMFPVLRRIPAIDQICGKLAGSEDRDPREQRRAAAVTLGQLLGLVARGRSFLLFVDDLQWGDEESGSLLREVLLTASGVSLRLVGCHRHPVEGSGIVARLLEEDAAIGHLEIAIGALGSEDSRELARALLGSGADEAHVARVAAEASGNPFLIRELVEFGGDLDPDERVLSSAVARHVEMLSEQARQVIELLAVAGRRLEVGVLQDATPGGEPLEATILLLRSQHLAKASDFSGEELETYHDRIREVIVGGLPPDALAARHRELADAYGGRSDPDPAILGFHREGAGERERAAELILKAALNAEQSLAPLNAAAHFAKAVELLPEGDPRYGEALYGQARNLSAAGRSASAAPIYLRLAEHAEPETAHALRQYAARAWVHAGDFVRAREALGLVLDAARLRIPRTLPGVLLGVARARLWLRRNGLRYEPLAEDQVSSETLLRIDTYETVEELYSSTDLFRTFLVHSSRLRECLEAGEPRRVARALVEEVVVGGIGGEEASEHGLELLRVAERAIEQGECPDERPRLQYARGFHAVLNGRYAAAVDALGDLAHAPGFGHMGQQMRTLRSALGYSRWWLGQWRTLTREYEEWTLDAVERGDQLSACVFRLEQGGQWGAILNDEPERAAEQMMRTLASPIARELAFEQISAKQTRAWLALYLGRPEEAERVLRMSGAEKTYLRVQRSRIEVEVLHAFAALARGPAGLRDAKRWLKKIRREKASWPQPVTRLLDASIAAREDHLDLSMGSLESAISAFDQQGMAMFSAAASWRLGELQGGPEGDARRADAEERIAAQGVKRPDRVARMLAPGFRDLL